MPLPHNLFGFVGIQADTEAGTAKASASDQTISKYEQEKRGVSAACASPWLFIANNKHFQCTPAGAFDSINLSTHGREVGAPVRTPSAPPASVLDVGIVRPPKPCVEFHAVLLLRQVTDRPRGEDRV